MSDDKRVLKTFDSASDMELRARRLRDWNRGRTQLILMEVEHERRGQEIKWGRQSHPDGTSQEDDASRAFAARNECDAADRDGKLTWRHISDEEIAEAYAESDPVKLRKELIQEAAVLVAWIEDIDARTRK